MSSSESLSTTKNIDELERRLRSINPQETGAEDALIVELAGRLAPKYPSPSLQAVSQPGPTDIKPMQPLEVMMQRSSADEMLGDRSETANVEVEAGQTLDFDDPYSCDPNEAELAVKKGSEGWKLRVSALALGCMVMIGALFDFAHAPPHNVSLAGAFVPAAAGAEQTRDAPEPTKRPPKAASETAGSAQPSNPKLGTPMKHLGKSTARIVLAEAGAIDPAAPAETSVHLEAPNKPENAPREPQASLALTEPQSAPAAPPASARQPGNPVGRASGELVSAVAVPVQSAQQRVDPSAATMSSGWAVQLPRQNRRPKQRATPRGSTRNMRPRSWVK
jgi:hypothetical protein